MSAKQRETELRCIAETECDRSQRLLYDSNMNLANRTRGTSSGITWIASVRVICAR